MHALARLGSLQLQQGQQQIHQQNGVVFPQRQCYGIGASVNGVSAVRAAELTDGVYCRTSSASPALGQVATSPDANFRSLTPKTDTSSCGGGPNNSLYKTELCRQWKEKKTCPYEERCQFAHGLEELRRVPRHPKYRTEKCRSFHMKGLCDYGPRCHFVHNYDKDSSRGEGLSLEGGKSSDGSPSFQSDTSPPLGTLLVSTQMSSTIYCAPPSNVNMASQILAPGANMAPQASPPSTEMSTSGSATQWNSGGSCNSVGHSASNSPPIGVVTITGTTVNPVNNCPPDFVAGDLPLKLAQLLATSEKDGIQPSYRNPGYGSPNQSANVSDGCNTVAYGNEVEASAKRLDVFRRLTGTRS